MSALVTQTPPLLQSQEQTMVSVAPKVTIVLRALQPLWPVPKVPLVILKDLPNSHNVNSALKVSMEILLDSRSARAVEVVLRQILVLLHVYVWD